MDAISPGAIERKGAIIKLLPHETSPNRPGKKRGPPPLYNSKEEKRAARAARERAKRQAESAMKRYRVFQHYYAARP